MMRVVLFLLILGLGQCLDILVFVPGHSNSHILFNYRFAAALTNKGHRVTLWTMLDWPLKDHNLKIPAGVEEFNVVIDLPAKNMSGQMSTMDEYVFKELGFADYQRIVTDFRRTFLTACQIQLEDFEPLIEKLSKRNYDLVLAHAFDFCPMAIANVMGFGTKFTLVTPGSFILDNVANILGLPVAPSYIPNAMVAYSDSIKFMDRVRNTLFYSMTFLMRVFPNLMSDEELLFRGPPHEDRPSFKELFHQIPSLFINGEPFLDFPRPLPFGISYLGELAAQNRNEQTKELPIEFKTILEKPSSKGAIIFSLGTIAKAKYMPIEMRQAFAEAFVELSDYEILWRFDAEVPEVDGFPHIHVVKWLPQRDLLNDPNIKLFITHGGYNSLLEVTKAGVPMVLIPLFFDQYGNGARAERHGLGIVVQKAKVTKESMLHAIRTILNDSQYKEKAKKLARTLNDKVVEPGDLLDHRVRFLAKKRHLFPTLNAGKHFNFFQYQSLDVLALFVVVGAISCYVMLRVLVICLRIAEGSSKKSEKI